MKATEILTGFWNKARYYSKLKYDFRATTDQKKIKEVVKRILQDQLHRSVAYGQSISQKHFNDFIAEKAQISKIAYCEDKSTIIGWSILIPHPDFNPELEENSKLEPEVQIFVKRDYRRHKIGTELISLMNCANCYYDYSACPEFWNKMYPGD